jgi:hypothetical protein
MRSPAAGSVRCAPPECARCADSCAREPAPRSRSAMHAIDGVHVDESSTVSRSIDEVALRSHWPPIPSHRAGRDRRSTARTVGSFGRPECQSWPDRPLFAGDRAPRRPSIAHVVDRFAELPHFDRVGPGPGLRGVACCLTPAAIVEQLHAQQGRVQAGPCQAPVGVVGRSVGEGPMALHECATDRA